MIATVAGIATDKIVLIVLDGVGAGELPDADRYGDRGSHTLANTARAVKGLRLPHLAALGLGNITPIEGVAPSASPRASYGRMAEASQGKDSTIGHWELGGIVLERTFPGFPRGFPPDLMAAFLKRTGCRGYLGNYAASGTAIIQELGDEHVRTGFPIVYTSADSVFQIAAHEEVIPLERLYEICLTARNEVCVGDAAVGRVIARPFLGAAGNYQRTTNRKDFSLVPPSDTVLDLLKNSSVPTVGIGKIEDLYAGRGLSESVHTAGNTDGISRIIQRSSGMNEGLLFANLVDFDMLYGHRNDPAGFAAALEEFDRALPDILATIGPNDLLLLTADHGNDPTTPGTDHSREYVPVLCCSARKNPGANLGIRSSFADLGKTVGEFFGSADGIAGSSFLALAR